MTSPIRPTDDEARHLARTLMREARFAALGVIGDDGCPLVTRVAFGLSPEGQPISLISTLSAHTRALQGNPACSLMVGEPGIKGDPLTHPRLSLQGRVRFVSNSGEEHDRLASHYLQSHPKAKLYIGFADFAFIRLELASGHLNGGFGKAFHLTPEDLMPGQ
ncbi:pyridoxamine 5'-phosphate oxidase family protein [Phaeobacter sp. PT47_59]|uniref:HugZ family pyridoxamine 5'-phosphate oxidase n=1 Tax=Phaeobacter sp. PT47_59 TaxID=3029979 RepID=UPI0023805012|nr:pyridoxamine 5'-phosphate oxidase family protein [Phaeobacter sp. PT47_59]MDE4176430.1 pyridoxamine 5'-phosphate oxidase family protein [Phaeobacter sp. PT47_59]